jgi:hypothetical protein
MSAFRAGKIRAPGKFSVSQREVAATLRIHQIDLVEDDDVGTGELPVSKSTAWEFFTDDEIDRDSGQEAHLPTQVATLGFVRVSRPADQHHALAANSSRRVTVIVRLWPGGVI